MNEAKQSDRGNPRDSDRKRRKRQPMQANAESLRRWALWYLDRYATSVGHLRRLMGQKIETSARVHGTDREDGRAAGEALLADLVRAGLLDDRAYACQRAGSLRRRGLSRRAIAARLVAKGLDSDDIQVALAEINADSEETELDAALRYSRRRRLGPYRPADQRALRRDRDLAALARQGFSYDLACRVIDAEDPESLIDPG